MLGAVLRFCDLVATQAGKYQQPDLVCGSNRQSRTLRTKEPHAVADPWYRRLAKMAGATKAKTSELPGSLPQLTENVGDQRPDPGMCAACATRVMWANCSLSTSIQRLCDP
ncbi:uncharacterized protein LOC102078693 isoform X3 [Oreochromis niloticus]|uniref:uncharacterized protein LOC102078693 isoform X3 n=1 Tax=Oreochromis niloticus TaxID=8128 RepID=UPI000DF3727F|nr:uncharacterized protein LOC102078693 isoform X3 [Oreochromis niloticus]